MRLAWTNADPSGGYTQALVVRRLNAPVDGPEDPEATLVFIGQSATATHLLTDLLPSVPEQTRVYHYAVFPCTAQGDCGSDGATATLSPTLPDALRGGGYVLHWRHAFADVCEDHLDLGTADNPLEPNWWKSCEADCDRRVGAAVERPGATRRRRSVAPSTSCASRSAASSRPSSVAASPPPS